MKKYYFLCGLPRSGNTLLSSILNQNKNIQVSANSFIPDVFCSLDRLFETDLYQNFPDKGSIENLMENVFDSYYKDIDANVIIDRSPWGIEGNLNYLKRYLNSEIKIICLVRPISEILCSFIKLNPSFLNKFNSVEEKCEYLLHDTSHLATYYQAIRNLTINEVNTQNLNFVLIDYKSLIENTEKVIDGIYNFLEIEEKFHHTFDYIEQFQFNNLNYDDKVFDCKLHFLKEKIEYKNYNVEEILPKNIIEKYLSGSVNFWENF